MLIFVVMMVSFIVFAAMDLAPGDAATAALGDAATPEQLEIYREMHGLNDPLLVRYFRYMAGILRRDLGTSAFNGEDVWTLFFSKFRYTLYLTATSLVITVVLSIPVGILAAVKRGTLWDSGSSAVSFVIMGMPNMWVGLLIIILFAVKLQWLPSSGADAGFKSIILPSITAGTSAMAALTRTTRSAMVDALSSDYLRTARSKGVPERVVIWKHSLGNASIPIVTQIGNQLASHLGGALVTERVHAWPGVGNYLVNAILLNDYEVVTGFVIMLSIVISLMLLIVDLVYAFMDPRVKAQYSKG